MDRISPVLYVEQRKFSQLDNDLINVESNHPKAAIDKKILSIDIRSIKDAIKILLLLIVSINMLPGILFAQSSPGDLSNSDKEFDTIIINGKVTEAGSGIPLPFVNIYLSKTFRGTISNEHGEYRIEIPAGERTNLIVFQSLGYQTDSIILPATDSFLNVELQVDIIQLTEMLVYANAPNASEIVEKIVANREKNYPKAYCGSSFFIRSRSNMHLKSLEADFKKSSLPSINESLVDSIKKNFPSEIMSFNDLLGKLYRSGTNTDSVNQKVLAVKAVALEDKNLDYAFEVIELLNQEIETNSDEEYWKVKSGFYGKEVTDESAPENGAKDKFQEQQTQTLRNLRYHMKNEMAFADLSDKERWDFLYRPKRYRFEIVGGTIIHGEEVYIIDFTPEKRGMYSGRFFVSATSYALIKADFSLAPGKTGKEIELLGITYREKARSASIYFEKTDHRYQVKYISTSKDDFVAFDRNVKLQKKKRSFLFDRTIEEIKVHFDFSLNNIESIDILMLDRFEVPPEEYRKLKENKTLDILYVNEFQDSVWKEYSIIEPTQQMKNYKRRE